jgi:DNA-binding transcriptional LysR family regulator
LYVIPYLKEFLDRYPKLRLHIKFTQTMPDLEKEKVDIIVGLSEGIPVHYIQRTLIHARWVFCASPDYLKKHGVPKKPSDLPQHQIITRIQREPNNCIEFKTGESILFEPYLYFNDTRAIRRSALQGLGIAQLHDYIIADDLKEKRLIEVLNKHTEQKKTIPIHISYFPTPHVHIKIRRFLDFMVEVAAR